MEYGDPDFQSAFQRLTPIITSDDEYFSAWVKFLCEDLPRFSGEILDEFIDDLSVVVDLTMYTQDHHDILEYILRRCFDAGSGQPNYPPYEIAALALTETIDLCQPENIEHQVYENISTPNAAKALAVLLQKEDNIHFWTFMGYLRDIGVVVPQDVGVIRAPTWNSSKRWPNHPDGNTPANRPGATPIANITDSDITDMHAGMEELLRMNPPSDGMGRE